MHKRQIIVTGVCTAGKSTFAHELVKKYFLQHICIDPIIEGFEAVFPELGITHKASTLREHIEVCQRFRPFVSRMIRGLEDDNFVLEGYRLPLEDLYKEFPHLQYFVFGYPNVSPEELVARCRQFDVDNWTNDMSDRELVADFDFMIEESKRLKLLCGKLNLPFFDTGANYWQEIESALQVVR